MHFIRPQGFTHHVPSFNNHHVLFVSCIAYSHLVYISPAAVLWSPPLRANQSVCSSSGYVITKQSPDHQCGECRTCSIPLGRDWRSLSPTPTTTTMAQRLEQISGHLSNIHSRGLLAGEVAIITGKPPGMSSVASGGLQCDSP
jgi:hypothetical protein